MFLNFFPCVYVNVNGVFIFTEIPIRDLRIKAVTDTDIEIR